MTTKDPSAFHPSEDATTRKSTAFSSSFRCPRCNKGGTKRNLIVCIDGTSNQFGRNNTNVMKLFDMVDHGASTGLEQHTYYSSGIGTRPKSSNSLRRVQEAISDVFDMAIAWNIDKNIKEAYSWLAGKYQEGDQIYFFGFSRGAYQVRVLAAMIHEVGLIKTLTEKQISMAYNHFVAVYTGNVGLEARQIAREFKKAFSWHDLRVHFIGVWDTVASVGLEGDIYPLMLSSVCHIRHALALDERRVKFMPEYFHEANPHKYNKLSKDVVPSLDFETFRIPVDGQHGSNDAGNDTDVKEVWFAGCHSDVGGKDRMGDFHQVGNISLLWMRREATLHGLVLQPTDITWGPNDIDLGVRNSMNLAWKMFEYLAITRRVSFGGVGANARREHWLEPRHIIPGQKVHASILYANAYLPHATCGAGFDLPMTRVAPEDVELDNQFWETDLFGDTEAEVLMDSLCRHGAAIEHIVRLLFMLRSKQGKQCVRNVSDWQVKFEKVINDPDCAPPFRLFTLVAYYEASCDPRHPQGCVHPRMVPSAFIFDDAKNCLHYILTRHKHRDGPRVVSLLKPLTDHEDLRNHILTREILDSLMELLGRIIRQEEVMARQAIDGLNSLLRCEARDTRQFVVHKLGEIIPNSTVILLSQILEVKDSLILIAALRMVMTLARIQEDRARAVCLAVKPRLMQLASKNEGLVGVLSVEILLALYDPDAPASLNLRNVNVRANMANALAHKNFNARDATEREGQYGRVDQGQRILRLIFGLDEYYELDVRRKWIIKNLKDAVQYENTARARTCATMTILKLYEAPVIRNYLCEIELLDVLIDQLQRKDTALLAAYALAISLEHDDMKESVRNNELFPKYIVGMLQLDLFDGTIGQIEGFDIFRNIMRHDNLREKIKRYNIVEVLERKLRKGKPNETRTGLICLNIYQSFDQNSICANELVEKSLRRLRNPVWKIQKAGVAVLSALARTEHGVEAIEPRVHEIIELLLPQGYLPILPSVSISNPEGGGQLAETATEFDTQSMDILINLSRVSWMMGPACALLILAQNGRLREIVRDTMQYRSLKDLYISGVLLVDGKDPSPWHIGTPNLNDVTKMLDMMIKAIDGELFEGSFMPIGDNVLPHIRHWDRLVAPLRNGVLGAVTVLPGLLAILGVTMVLPIYLGVRVSGVCRGIWSHYRHLRFLNRLYDGRPLPVWNGGQTNQVVIEGEESDREYTQNPLDDESHQDVEV